MNDFLTKSEQVVFIRFLNELEYLERGHYLAIIAVDTPALAGEITNQILQKKNNSTVLEYTGSVEILQSAFQNTGSDRSIRILNILALPTSKFGKALQQLNFQRDYITDFNLKIVLLCSHLFLQQMQTKAFDFVSIASFKVFFTDKQAAVAQSLQPVGQKPIEVMEFEEMDAELKKYRKLKNKDKELYLRKIFNTAYAAYEISRNDYSLQLYIEALHLATVLNNTKYISGINGKP
ncbi:MAG: hypothetical protein HY738_07770 [Bacteroidia bacterium]|nr:hypothetical protein [Bacteroidia bacterium]